MTEYKVEPPTVTSAGGHTSLGLDITMTLDEAFMLGYYNGEWDEHSRLGGDKELPPHHHNGHIREGADAVA